MVRLREVAVADLPWPWHPVKCRWQERFERLFGDRDLDDRARAETFSSLAQSLTAEEVLQWPYHAANWRLAADFAVLLHRRDGDPLAYGLEAEVRRSGGGSQEVRAIRPFWVFPLKWSVGGAVVGNGQHRICALKLAGAEIALVHAS